VPEEQLVIVLQFVAVTVESGAASEGLREIAKAVVSKRIVEKRPILTDYERLCVL
jgi:hypothetical protein